MTIEAVLENEQQWHVEQGDALAVLKSMPNASIDAVVTDPPYGLGFMGQEWDSSFRRAENPDDAGRDNVFGRTSRTSPEHQTGQDTFDPSTLDERVGKRDQLGPEHWRTKGRSKPRSQSAFANGAGEAGSYDFRRNNAFQLWCEQWAAECLRVLKPGGHLLSFGGTRTYHRLAAGIEDAGFEIRDSIIWLFGSGFPKSRNLDGDWEGWGTALKPGHEPIVVARKPMGGGRHCG